ncbi:MAG: hypothetical protein CMO11_03045 [Thaumarchaeota archaeon]|nr:hypothetical protein [Nitrososphaerota archaeon]
MIFKHSLLNAIQHNGKAELGAVINKMIAEDSTLKLDIKQLISEIKPILNQINSMSQNEQIKNFQKDFPNTKTSTKKDEKFSLPDLPNFATYEQIITRFSPNPNGYLHIGHVKAFRLNARYADQHSGKFLLRFDDTNPNAVDDTFYKIIEDNLAWMGFKFDKISYSSDYLPQIYEITKKMLIDNYLYICDCAPEIIKTNRLKKQECEHRNTVNHSKKIEKFFSSPELSNIIIRFKGDMNSDNTAMRDPTMMRIINSPHPRKGTEYRIWPTYDLTAPIIDCLEKVTHVLRSKEFELRNELYDKITKIVFDQGKVKTRPSLVNFSRVLMKGSPTSKSVINNLIEKGQITEWNDPRLVTISALRRRGFVVDGINNFVDSLGISKSESSPSMELIASFNRKARDKTDKRYFFVKDPIKLKITNVPIHSVTLKHHPTENLGSRTIIISDEFWVSSEDLINSSEGEVIRLMDLFNIEIKKKTKMIIEADFDSRKPIPKVRKIHWVAIDGIPFKLRIPNNDEFFINSDGSFQFKDESDEIYDGFAETSCESLLTGELIQFNRIGFCRVDSPNLAILSHK